FWNLQFMNNTNPSGIQNFGLVNTSEPHGNTVKFQWQPNSMVLLQEPEFLAPIQLNSPQHSNSPSRFTTVSSPSRSHFSSPNISSSPEQFVNPADLTTTSTIQFQHQLSSFPQISQISDLQDFNEIGQPLEYLPDLISQPYQFQHSQFGSSGGNPAILGSFMSENSFNLTNEDPSTRSRVPSHRGIHCLPQSISTLGNLVEPSPGSSESNIVVHSQMNIPIPPYNRPRKHKKSQSISGPSPLGFLITSANDQQTENSYFNMPSFVDPNNSALDSSGFVSTENQISQTKSFQTGHRRVYSGQQPLNYKRFSNSHLPVNSVRLDYPNQLPLSIQPQSRNPSISYANPPASSMNLTNNRINRNPTFNMPNTSAGFRLVSHNDGTVSPELISPSPTLTTTSNSIASSVNSSSVSLNSVISMNSMNSHFNSSSNSLNSSINSGPGTPSENIGMNHSIYLDENYVIGRINELQPRSRAASFSSQMSNFDNQHQLGFYQLSTQYDNAQYQQQQQAQQLIQQRLISPNFQQLQQHEYSFPISPITQNFGGMALQSPGITENNPFALYHMNFETQSEIQRMDVNAHLTLDTQLSGIAPHDQNDMEDEESDEGENSDLYDETYISTLQNDGRHSESYVCGWKDCLNSFESIDQLQGKQNYKCLWNDCTRQLKPFGKRHKIVSHVRVHTGEKPYPCEFQDCGRYFARLDGLNTHFKTHSDVKPYICEVTDCEKAYYHPRSLRKHLKNSHPNWEGMFPIKCEDL
ncbi:Zinc finger protein ZIC 2, partial [Nowakowskiella sp. JEL0078]